MKIGGSINSSIANIVLKLVFSLLNILVAAFFIQTSYDSLVEVLFSAIASLGLIPIKLTYFQAVKLTIAVYLLKDMFMFSLPRSDGE